MVNTNTLVQKTFLSRTEKQHCDLVMRGNSEPVEYYYHGYWPAARLKQKISVELERLLDFLPSNTHLRARVERDHATFKMYLVLNFNDGSIYAAAEGVTARKALRSLLDQSYIKIRQWRKDRGQENETAIAPKPIRKASQVSEDSRPDWKFSPRVLIVDDNPVSVMLIEACFRQQGCETSVVTTGREAVQEITGNDYDLVVLDWQMPDLNGGETLACAQEILSYDENVRMPWISNQLPVVTYSGEEKENLQIPACENFDFVGHIPKGSSVSELRRMTANLLQTLNP